MKEQDPVMRRVEPEKPYSLDQIKRLKAVDMAMKMLPESADATAVVKAAAILAQYVEEGKVPEKQNKQKYV